MSKDKLIDLINNLQNAIASLDEARRTEEKVFKQTTDAMGYYEVCSRDAVLTTMKNELADMILAEE